MQIDALPVPNYWLESGLAIDRSYSPYYYWDQRRVEVISGNQACLDSWTGEEEGSNGSNTERSSFRMHFSGVADGKILFAHFCVSD